MNIKNNFYLGIKYEFGNVTGNNNHDLGSCSKFFVVVFSH